MEVRARTEPTLGVRSRKLSMAKIETEVRAWKSLARGVGVRRWTRIRNGAGAAVAAVAAVARRVEAVFAELSRERERAARTRAALNHLERRGKQVARGGVQEREEWVHEKQARIIISRDTSSSARA